MFYHVSLFTGKLHLWRDVDRSHVVQPFVPPWRDRFLAVDRIGEASVVQSTGEESPLKRGKKRGKGKRTGSVRPRCTPVIEHQTIVGKRQRMTIVPLHFSRPLVEYQTTVIVAGRSETPDRGESCPRWQQSGCNDTIVISNVVTGFRPINPKNSINSTNPTNLINAISYREINLLSSLHVRVLAVIILSRDLSFLATRASKVTDFVTLVRSILRQPTSPSFAIKIYQAYRVLSHGISNRWRRHCTNENISSRYFPQNRTKLDT